MPRSDESTGGRAPADALRGPASEAGRGRRRAERMGRALASLCGGALAFNLLLVFALLGLLAWEGLGVFWPKPLELLRLRDGSCVLGEVQGERAHGGGVAGTGAAEVKLRCANRDLGAAEFRWIPVAEIARRERPTDAVLLERWENGGFIGFVERIERDGEVLAEGPDETWNALSLLLDRKKVERARLLELEKDVLGDVNRRIEDLRLERRRLESAVAGGDDAGRHEELDAAIAVEQVRYEQLAERLRGLRREHLMERLIVRTADGAEAAFPAAQVVRALRPNELGWRAKVGIYASRVGEFLSGQPRESNTEGGILPAIFGTVLMVFLMSIVVVPLGVLAALHLREYATQGRLVRLVRIAVNSLAGTPSIVFGVFGLGFFVYVVGGSIDALCFAERLPAPTYGTGGILWASLTLALLTVPVVIVATEEGLAAVPRGVREGSLALGATRWETLRRVVLPASAPAMLTGMILAMGRAAGEVAPLMIVGMVKLAPDLPIDGEPPFIHFERKFMHLGFHIFDLGFQSPNVEATKPLVFATALLLVMLVTSLNLGAIRLRNHLRARLATPGV